MTAFTDYKKEIRQRQRDLKRELRELEKQAAVEQKRLDEVAHILGQSGVELCTADNPEQQPDQLTVRQLFDRAVAEQQSQAEARRERARRAAETRRAKWTSGASSSADGRGSDDDEIALPEGFDDGSW